MKRIAISQRRDAIPGRDETRDALDVRIAEILWDLGFLPLPIPSGIAAPAVYLEMLAPDGILLSGGNDIGSVPERDTLETAALDYAANYQVPVLGICRGLQMINIYQAGRLRPLKDHVAVTHQINGPLLSSKGWEVNSYHGNGVMAEDLGHDLEAIAWARDGSIEAVRHKRHPWLAIMWHPEREAIFSKADKDLIYTFLTLGVLP